MRSEGLDGIGWSGVLIAQQSAPKPVLAFNSIEAYKSSFSLSSNACTTVPASLGITEVLDYHPHPCGCPFGPGIACLNLFQKKLS